MKTFIPVFSAIPLFSLNVAAYNLIRDYSGQNFFSGWDYYGNWDNLTNGDVQFVDQADATSQKLAYVNDAGNAIIKVDNTTNVPWNDKRNSVRIETQDYYSIGTVWIIDLNHIPYGCSVWPSFWTTGANWPAEGEIDIIEGVNLMQNNQMAIHSTSGCTKTTPSNQTGSSGETDCSVSAGCTVTEKQDNSYGEGFASAGGGVFATQFDTDGIYMWFWSRSNVPSSISSNASSVDVSSWGNPSAAYPSSSCDISNYFGPQQLVLDITLCGDWAGANATYHQTCNANGVCYNDNVIGAGSPTYDNAYFEVASVRVYANDNASVVGPSGTAAASTVSTATSGSSATVSAGSTSTSSSLATANTWTLGLISALSLTTASVYLYLGF